MRGRAKGRPRLKKPHSAQPTPPRILAVPHMTRINDFRTHHASADPVPNRRRQARGPRFGHSVSATEGCASPATPRGWALTAVARGECAQLSETHNTHGRRRPELRRQKTAIPIHTRSVRSGRAVSAFADIHVL